MTWKLSVQGGAFVFLAEPPGGKTNQQGPPILKVYLKRSNKSDLSGYLSNAASSKALYLPSCLTTESYTTHSSWAWCNQLSNANRLINLTTELRRILIKNFLWTQAFLNQNQEISQTAKATPLHGGEINFQISTVLSAGNYPTLNGKWIFWRIEISSKQSLAQPKYNSHRQLDSGEINFELARLSTESEISIEHRVSF